MRRSVLIDGQEFRWNTNESFAKNVNQMGARRDTRSSV
jgi:hypothetical protein